MSKLNEVFNILFPNNQKIIELNNKIENLESTIKKSALSNSLEGVIGGQLYSLGVNESKNSYGSNYIVWRGINMLSQSIAALPLKIYRGQEEMNPDFRLSNGFNLGSPNTEMSLYELLYQSLIYYFYRGEFMIYIDLEDRISLEPINPQKMTKNKDGNWKWNNKKIIPIEQLIYLPLFNPDNSNGRGLSPIDVVKKEVLTDDKAREYNTKFFENFGQVGGTLFDEKGQATTSDMQTLVNEFNSKHQGSDKAHKTLGLPAGIKYQELGQTMKEMQFLESRKDIRDRILSILGIHKSVFGVTDQVDRAVADTAMRQLWIHTLQPNTTRIQNKLNQHLFKRYFPAYHCKFDLSEVVELQENKKDILERARIYRELGYTINEINGMFDLGMDEITDPIGDMRFVPSSLIPMDDLLINLDDSSKIVPSKGDKLDNLAKYLEKEDKIEKVNHTYVRKYNIIRRWSEKKIAGKMGKYFSNQLGKVMSVVKDKKDITKINETEVLALVGNLFNEEKSILTTTIKPVFESVSEKAAGLAVDTLKLSTEPIVNELVVNNMVNKIVDINKYTYKLLRNQIKESVLAGESVDKLSRRIKRVYKFNSSRSRTIARTESGAMINRTTNAIYKDNSDIVKRKQWVGGTRETHAAQDGMIIDFNETFPNGLLYPHDPSGEAGEVINCTCCMAPIVKG